MQTKTILKIIMISVIVLVFCLPYLFYKNKPQNQAIEQAYLRMPFNWSNMKEKESRYTDMMIRILTTYSFRNDKKYRKCMNRNQKIEYIKKNFQYATAMHFGLYDVPVIHQKESNFNPYLDHDYGEVGIAGFKWGTALLSQRILSLMPPKLKRMLWFDLKTKNDLKDPIIALKCTYALLWYERRQFHGREDWYISIFHWGGFLSTHWNKGEGDIPITFTLNGIKYNVIAYVIDFFKWRSAYELGMIEPSRAIKEKYEKIKKKMVKEEIDYRNTRRIIKRLRKQLKEKNEIKQQFEDKLKEIDKVLLQSEISLRKISGESKRGGGKKALLKVKDVVKNILKKLKVKK